jgi:putative peptidoglycan lipid II flippase
VFRSGLIISLASLLSRLLGFVRDVLIAAMLGAGPVADAFLIAFRLPNLVRRILGEGGLNAVFVPLHAQVMREGSEQANRFLGQAMSALGALLILLTALVLTGAGFVVLLLGAGSDPGVQEQAAFLLRWSFPGTIGMALAAMLGAALTTKGRFSAPALGLWEVNGLLILALLLLALLPLTREQQAFWLACSCSLAGFFQFATLAFVARRENLHLFARPTWQGPLRSLAINALPALIASGAAQLMLVAALQAASRVPSGVSWFTYAERVFGLPLSAVSVILGFVILPELAKTSDEKHFQALQEHSLVSGLSLTIPAATGLFVLGEMIAHVLFERGAFSAFDARQTGAILQALALGLPFAWVGRWAGQILGFQTKILRFISVAAAIAGMGVTWSACIVLMPGWGPAGLGLGVSLGLVFHAGIQAVALMGVRKFPFSRAGAREIICALAASCMMGGALVFATSWVATRGAIALFLLIVLAMAGYGACFWLLRVMVTFRPVRTR